MKEPINIRISLAFNLIRDVFALHKSDFEICEKFAIKVSLQLEIPRVLHALHFRDPIHINLGLVGILELVMAAVLEIHLRPCLVSFTFAVNCVDVIVMDTAHHIATYRWLQLILETESQIETIFV